MTVAQLCDQYEKDTANDKKIKTIKSDKGRIELHIKPGIGKLKVATITREQIEAFIRETLPGSARRILGLLGAIFSYAIKKTLRTDNPTRGIDTPSDNKKTRRLSDGEYAQLWSAINRRAPEHKTVTEIFLLLAVTGWRSGEARQLKWDEIDFERHCATLTDTKTGKSVRPLSGVAIEIIQRQPRKSEYVFLLQDGKPAGNISPQWAKLGLDKTITPHTLRHSFASLAGDIGLADSTIAGLLGHSRQSITSRYIHLDKALIAAANEVAGETLRLMQGPQ
jgi:integrase